MHGPAELKLNELLAALPPDVLLSWQPHLESVDMPLGQVLYVSGDVPHHVFFPTTAIVSLLFVSESGSTSEIAVVGRDSLVGISIFMGGGSTAGW
jgi:CRP-like cAMP-binding protein